MITAAEQIAMGKAIELAQNDLVPLGPNPRVGCVVMSAEGQYLSQGFHLGKGTAHAEVAALQSVVSEFSGATAIVTLEPCYRSDRNTDCARALVKSGIKRVIFAQSDNTIKSRGGAKFLRDHGVEVIGGVMSEEASSLNPWLTVAMQQQRPYVRVKIASSLDGRIAAKDGSSKWITDEQARSYAHQFRSASHVVISSTKSVIQDNSRLSARNADNTYLPAQPRVLLMGSDEIPKDHPIRQEPVEFQSTLEHDIELVLQNLWREQDLSVLVEAGPTLATSFIRSGLVNEILWFTAPILVGDSGIPAIGDLGISSISKALRPHLYSSSKLGIDNLMILQLTTGN